MLITEETYKIDFAVLENNNPKTIVILDQSNYLSTPEKPLLFITLPGFTGHIEIPYVANNGNIIILNSDDLNLTEKTDYEEYANLPDGVYQIRMAVCPYDELTKKICYIKTTELECKFNNLLLNIGTECCIDQNELEKEIVSIDVLIMSAKAEVTICNVEKATKKYQKALQKINNLNKKLNCK